VLGDSNNPKPEGLGYGKSQDFGLNLTAMPPAPSPIREGEAKLLGFVDFWVRILTSTSTS